MHTSNEEIRSSTRGRMPLDFPCSSANVGLRKWHKRFSSVEEGYFGVVAAGGEKVSE
jgi:hypothetical protein